MRGEKDERRYPVECDCGQGDPAVHVICSVCGDDWDDCQCGAPLDEDLIDDAA